MRSEIFEISEEPNKITAVRKPSFVKRLIVFIAICALLISILFSNYAIVLMISFSFLLLGIPVGIVTAIFYFKYPIKISIMYGCISIKFRRFLLLTKTIEITSQSSPTIIPDACVIRPYFIDYWHARVNVESKNVGSIMIYLKRNSSGEEAAVSSIEMAKSISGITGFPLELFSCGLTSASS